MSLFDRVIGLTHLDQFNNLVAMSTSEVAKLGKVPQDELARIIGTIVQDKVKGKFEKEGKPASLDDAKSTINHYTLESVEVVTEVVTFSQIDKGELVEEVNTLVYKSVEEKYFQATT